MTINDYYILASIALLGGFSHCIGMCGGIVTAYSAKLSTANKYTQTISHLVYSFGRVTTYIVLGAIFGSIGSVVSFSHTANGVLYFLAGIFMVLSGLSLIGKIRFLTILEHSFSQSNIYKNIFQKLFSQKSIFSLYLLGILNGLLPCGFVYFFAIKSASSANMLDGAIVMAIFGLSTIPAMFSLGMFISLTKFTDLRNILLKIAASFVIIYGIYTIYIGYKFIIDPNRSARSCACSV